jgi:hypothetical protein
LDRGRRSVDQRIALTLGQFVDIDIRVVDGVCTILTSFLDRVGCGIAHAVCPHRVSLILGLFFSALGERIVAIAAACRQWRSGQDQQRGCYEIAHLKLRYFLDNLGLLFRSQQKTVPKGGCCAISEPRLLRSK